MKYLPLLLLALPFLVSGCAETELLKKETQREAQREYNVATHFHQNLLDIYKDEKEQTYGTKEFLQKEIKRDQGRSYDVVPDFRAVMLPDTY